MSVTLTQFADFQVIQRDGSDEGALVISGTYAAESPVDVQARVVDHGTTNEVVTWTTIDASPGGGTFSGTLSGIPAGGWYNIDVRTRDITPSVLSTDDGTTRVGVGSVIGVAGQSNAENLFTDGAALSPTGTVVKYTDAGWSATIGGDGAIALGNMVEAVTGFPVGLLHYGVGSTALLEEADAGSGWWLDPTANEPLDEFLDGVVAATAPSANAGRLETIVWIQGERDAVEGTVTTAEYEAGLTTLFSTFRAAIDSKTGGTCPIVIGPLGRATSGVVTDEIWNGIRLAQKNVDDDDSNAVEAHMFDLDKDDDYHLAAVAYQEYGQRIAAAILGVTGESGLATLGPAITDCMANMDGTVLTMTVDADLVAATAYETEGFRLEDASLPVMALAAARTGTRNFTIATPGKRSALEFDDWFTDSDATSLDAHTPLVDGSSNGWTEQNGQWVITSNRAEPSGVAPGGPQYVATFEGSANGVIDGIVTSMPSSGSTYGLVFRYVDNDNFWAVLCRNQATDIVRLFKRTTAGGFVSQGTVTGTTQSTTQVIKACFDGGTIKVYVDDVLGLTVNDTQFSTATLCGIRATDDQAVISKVRLHSLGAPVVPGDIKFLWPYGQGTSQRPVTTPKTLLTMPSSGGTVELPLRSRITTEPPPVELESVPSGVPSSVAFAEMTPAYTRETLTVRNNSTASARLIAGTVVELDAGTYIPVAEATGGSAAGVIAIASDRLESTATQDVPVIVRGPAVLNGAQLELADANLSDVRTAFAALNPPIIVT